MDFTQNYEVPDIPPQAYLYFPLGFLSRIQELRFFFYIR